MKLLELFFMKIHAICNSNTFYTKMKLHILHQTTQFFSFKVLKKKKKKKYLLFWKTAFLQGIYYTKG